MDNRVFRYLAEGECDEKLLKALKLKPALIHPGKVERFNVVQNVLPIRKLMQFSPGSVVVLVFDTDKEETEILKKNLELLASLNFKVEVLTIVQVLNFEDEIERSTDVKRVQDFTRSKSIEDFKSSLSKTKETDLRNALKRHKFDLNRLWTKNPPKAFSFVKQDAERVKKR